VGFSKNSMAVPAPAAATLPEKIRPKDGTKKANFYKVQIPHKQYFKQRSPNLAEDIPLTITRTIYDPASKDFVFDSGEAKALPSIRDWINDHNPVIYWYILRIDNPTDTDISQWAVELYTHQALTIAEAYIEGSDRRFHLKKRERDAWSEKCVLSIPKQMGIPIVGKGARRLYFKIDINCKEGLMHEYGISGKYLTATRTKPRCMQKRGSRGNIPQIPFIFPRTVFG
jgi:hypothetical protein